MNWYCVYTKPKKEGQVEAYCRTFLGLETFYPQLREYATVRQIRRLVLEPLFPRYFFCRFEPAEFYRAVLYAPDALDIVNLAGGPAIVGDALIAELRQWVEDRFKARISRSPLSSGESVKIIDGPLRGLAAVILHARNDQDRVAILLSLLDGEAKISIKRDWLRPAAQTDEPRTARGPSLISAIPSPGGRLLQTTIPQRFYRRCA